MTTTLIVARHGNTFNKGDVVRRVGARTDLHLTEEGLRQGGRLGRNLLEAGLKPNRFFSAPLLRTVETCVEAAKVFDVTSPPELVDFLTELDYGEFDGLSEEEVLFRLGALESDSSEIKFSSKERAQFVEKGKIALKNWDESCVLPKGWDFLQPKISQLPIDWNNFAARLLKESPGSCNLVVTSNGIARFALSLARNGNDLASTKLSTGAYGVFVSDGSEWVLQTWNVR